MRTKKLLLAAALSAAGLATALAQSNVYSLNVVGYINIPTTNTGLYLVAPSQLDFDGTGVNNTLLTTFGTGQGGVNYPNLTHVYAFNKTTGGYDNALFNAGTWLGGVAAVTTNGLQSGQGLFFEKVAGGPNNLTFVGNVRQGVLNNKPFTGVNIISSMVPQAGKVETDLGLSLIGSSTPPLQTVYRHVSNDPLGTPYHQFAKTAAGWAGGTEPSVNVGEAFFLRANADATWTRNFTVQ
jgi:hypothetical protein